MHKQLSVNQNIFSGGSVDIIFWSLPKILKIQEILVPAKSIHSKVLGSVYSSENKCVQLYSNKCLL